MVPRRLEARRKREKPVWSLFGVGKGAGLAFDHLDEAIKFSIQDAELALEVRGFAGVAYRDSEHG